jgi:hypothetical protein
MIICKKNQFRAEIKFHNIDPCMSGLHAAASDGDSAMSLLKACESRTNFWPDATLTDPFADVAAPDEAFDTLSLGSTWGPFNESVSGRNLTNLIGVKYVQVYETEPPGLESAIKS